jgi:hypothetical protein
MYDKKTHRTNEVFKLLKVIKTKTTITFKKKTKGLLFSEVCGTIKLKKNSSLLCCFFFQFF